MRIDGQAALGHVLHLACDIGARLVGSPGADRAAAYVEEQFSAAGLRVACQEFPALYGSAVAHSVEVLDPALGAVASSPVLLSADTPPEGLEGELTILEGSDDLALESRPLSGRIVLWVIGSRAEFQTRLEALARRGPKAILIGWPATGIPPKNQQLPEVTARRGLAMPALCISFEQACAIAAAGALRARVVLTSRRFEGRTSNLIADVPGSKFPEEVVIVGAHYDTAPDVSGAIDNASGVALILELARHFAARGSARTLRFIAWGGEKAGMIGSRHYVAAARSPASPLGTFTGERRLEQHLLCISVDGVGLRLHRDACYTSTDPSIAGALGETARDLGAPLSITDSYFGSDSEMLTEAGVPGLSFGQEGPGLSVLHTSGDRIEVLDAERLGRLGELIGTFLSRSAARADPWPFERAVPPTARERARRWLKAKGWIDLVPDEAHLNIDYRVQS